jgi:hypothetical protein
MTSYTLPQRRAHNNELRASNAANATFPVVFQGHLSNFAVYTVDIGFPCYRLANGRTRAAQLELLATEQLDDDFFGDPDSAVALARQDAILRETVNGAGLLKAFRKTGQSQPLVLDNEGYVINGNRRLCAMRLLLENNPLSYAHFQHVQVLFLPPCSERDIKELEGRLQVQPDLRENYAWTAEAMLYRDLRRDEWTDEQIGQLYDKRVTDIREMIAMLDDGERFLEAKGHIGRYSILVDKEYALRQLQKCRKRCGDDEARKQFFTEVVHVMLGAGPTDGRLYDAVPEAFKCLDDIAARVRSELSSDAIGPPDETEGLDLLGSSAASDLAPLTAVMRPSENAAEAHAIITDSIQEARSRDRVQKDAAFCRRLVQQAHTSLQSALGALDASADTSGIPNALDSIDSVTGQIRTWLRDASHLP